LRAGDVVGNMHCMAPDFLSHQIDRSLTNLGLETIDVFYLHNPETQIRFTSAEQFDDRLRQAFVRLETLCAQSKIRWYGTATWGGYRQKPGQPERLDLTRVLELARDAGGDDHRFRFIQLPLNLMMPEAYAWPHATLNGEDASVLEIATEAGLTVIASAALMQARLASGLTQELRQLLAGPASDAQFALQFARSTPGICTALAGMSSPAHVAENLELQSFPPAPLDAYLSLYRREA
jgi:aryl-alcohol dehydrogenase-like predicted oxidoreductase